MSEQAVLIFGAAIAQGALRPLSWDDIKSDPYPAEGEFRWYHLNRASAEGEEWLEQVGIVPEILCEALYQHDTRPRAVSFDEGLGLNLRGVTSGHDIREADLVSLSLFASAHIVITTRALQLQAAEELRERFAKGYVPKNTGDIVAFLAQRTVHLIDPIILKLEEDVDRLEDDMLNEKTPPAKLELAQFRRSVLSVRRYITPQREAITNLMRLGESLIDKHDLLELREALDTTMRHSEYLDVIRERALVIQEQIVELRAEAMNQRLFVLAIISAVFLPLGFITGLFGVNVGGMPWAGSEYGFAILSSSLAGLTFGLIFLFRKMKWL